MNLIDLWFTDINNWIKWKHNRKTKKPSQSHWWEITNKQEQIMNFNTDKIVTKMMQKNNETIL